MGLSETTQPMNFALWSPVLAFLTVTETLLVLLGITLVVDRPNGERVRTSVYYNKGRLYLAQADVTPARGDKDMIVPSRFDQTVRFPPDGRFD